MKRIAILGSTGSIGTQRAGRGRRASGLACRVVGLAAGRRAERSGGADRALPPGDRGHRERRRSCRRSASAASSAGTIAVVGGPTGSSPSPRIPTSTSCSAPRRARRRSKPCSRRSTPARRIALANKEVLVMAGALVTRAARARGVALLPVDSEHNAIHQCLHGRRPAEVTRLILTASGGPFRTWPAAKLEHAHARGRAAASDVADGPQDHDRLGHADEQGPRGDRGALAVRRARRPHRRAWCTRSRSCTRWWS